MLFFYYPVAPQVNFSEEIIKYFELELELELEIVGAVLRSVSQKCSAQKLMYGSTYSALDIQRGQFVHGTIDFGH